METIDMPQAESRSADLIKENIEQLKQIFPEVIKEGRVDFEALHDLLGEYGDTAEERFCLNWAGKAEARREAQKRSTGTLRPCEEDSVDWDTTENLYIEGDNLEVLKLLQKSYHKKVKMIYIDPPYNTGKDFVYKDNYKDNMSNYLDLIGEDRKMSTKALSDSDGRYHSNWLNMMYPRLKLARNLLSDDGVIFISIDDNEIHNLRKVCDEVFGEENFIAQFIWKKKQGGGNDSNLVVGEHEYILSYCRNIGLTKLGLDKNYKLDDNLYPLKDERGEYGLITLDKSSIRFSESLVFEIIDKEGNKYNPRIVKGKQSCWRWGKKKVEEEFDKLVFKDGKVYTKYYRPDGVTPKSLLIDAIYGRTETGNDDIKLLFENNPFSYPKPLLLVKHFLSIGAISNNDIILDFFSGSATTAHAVMQLNAEDGGNRKYICVQIPEATPEDSEARKAGYSTIPEIAKERIRRAGKKILDEQKAKNDGLFAEESPKLDVGFKVFKLDSSNIISWDGSPENLEQALTSSLFNIKDDRTERDLLYEILIKYGIELSTKINSYTIAGKTVYEMGAGSLIVCLADNITTEVAEGIAKLWKTVSPEGTNIPCRVVFKDNGFNGSDEVKSNTLLILKQHGIKNVASV